MDPTGGSQRQTVAPRAAGAQCFGRATTQQSQPVEFNDAITYVNKVKNRFYNQPEVYKHFLAILTSYQKKNKESGGKPFIEAEVYSQIARLFQNHIDLLKEFAQFLPLASNYQGTSVSMHNRLDASQHVRSSITQIGKNSFPANNSSVASCNYINNGSKIGIPGTHLHATSSYGTPGQPSGTCIKRSPTSFTAAVSNRIPSICHSVPAKKRRLIKSNSNTSQSNTGKYGANVCLADYAFFDKVRKVLGSHSIYNDFMRCIVLFNEQVISQCELLQLVSPFLISYPEVMKKFKTILGITDRPSCSTPQNSTACYQKTVGSISKDCSLSLINNKSIVGHEELSSKLSMDIDYKTCERVGASYCILPKTYEQAKCGGRTPLCEEVLNDTVMSYPTRFGESTFVTSKKTQFEEYMYRCEDERFELDIVIETNAATIRVLENVKKKLCSMPYDVASRYTLDDCLGGDSHTIHQQAIRRLYGAKSADIIAGLKNSPAISVPVVLRRLKAKDEEWRRAQKEFNKIWRQQNEKYYFKSLDHQGINFKQNDLKYLQSKSLINEIELLYDERNEQSEPSQTGPHMIFQYKNKAILDDAADLLIMHTKKSVMQKPYKQRIKCLLRQFIPDLFSHPRQDLSEDEKECDEMEVETNQNINDIAVRPTSKSKEANNNERSTKNENVDMDLSTFVLNSKGCQTVFYGNNKWYLFLRLHNILCDRLTRLYDRVKIMEHEEDSGCKKSRLSTAEALRLKPKNEYLADIEVNGYYSAFLDMVKNVLDGNMETEAFEDTLREMFGCHAYIAFTLDKVVSHAVRQLHHLVTDTRSRQCITMFMKERRYNEQDDTILTQVANEGLYQRKVLTELGNENCFKIIIVEEDCCLLTIELLDSDSEDELSETAESEKQSACEQSLGNSHEGDKSERKAIFLMRNIRQWRAKVGQRFEETENTSSRKSESVKEKESSENYKCNFNLDSYRTVFVVNKENVLYRRKALYNAKQSHPSLSKRLAERFKVWHENWKSKHITHPEKTIDWLMGRAPDAIRNVTRVFIEKSTDKPPYRPYNRYRVKKLQETESQ